MKKVALTLSIVIPVYNEEDHLKACLDSIAAQTVPPDEVIVVDNNSTDRSVEIAQSYPFVKIVREPKQGITPARNRGFNVASGNILARIDADAVIWPNWVELAKRDFVDPDVIALSGMAKAATIPGVPGIETTFWSKVYFGLTDAFFGVTVLWGSNMALRKPAWQAIKSETCGDDKLVHEDEDLSYVIAGHGWKVLRDKNWLVKTEDRSVHYWPKYSEYVRRRRQTKEFHKNKGTLNNPKANTLPKWKVWLLTTIYILPRGFFATTSYISWILGKARTALTGGSTKKRR